MMKIRIFDSLVERNEVDGFGPKFEVLLSKFYGISHNFDWNRKIAR